MLHRGRPESAHAGGVQPAQFPGSRLLQSADGSLGGKGRRSGEASTDPSPVAWTTQIAQQCARSISWNTSNYRKRLRARPVPVSLFAPVPGRNNYIGASVGICDRTATGCVWRELAKLGSSHARRASQFLTLPPVLPSQRQRIRWRGAAVAWRILVLTPSRLCSSGALRRRCSRARYQRLEEFMSLFLRLEAGVVISWAFLFFTKAQR